VGDLDPIYTGCLWPTRVSLQNNIWIGSAVFAELANVTNIQTHRHADHATPSVTRGRILCTESPSACYSA